MSLQGEERYNRPENQATDHKTCQRNSVPPEIDEHVLDSLEVESQGCGCWVPENQVRLGPYDQYETLRTAKV